MHEAEAAGRNVFFLAHIFFLVVFVALVAALVIVLVKRRQPLPLALATLPMILIFTTAFLARPFPLAHQIINVFYDAQLVFNALYFWHTGPRYTGPLYLVCVLGTALDFAMHFVIKIA
jgi:hypothetical protein